MRPDYGTGLKGYMFASINSSTLHLMKNMLLRSVLLHEPRVETESLNLVQDEGNGRVEFELIYKNRLTNSRNNFVYPFYLENP